MRVGVKELNWASGDLGLGSGPGSATERLYYLSETVSSVA